jgi:hypothetical protein
MSSPTNEIKALAKLPSMPFPYLVTLLILLPFFLFRIPKVFRSPAPAAPSMD